MHLLLIGVDGGDELSEEVVELFSFNEAVAICVVMFPHLITSHILSILGFFLHHQIPSSLKYS